MKTVFVLGASGFIGQNLTKTLLNKGFGLISILPPQEQHPVTFLNPNKGEYEILETYPQENIIQAGKIKFIKGDITSIAFLIDLFQKFKATHTKIDYIVNLAGCSTIQKAKEDSSMAWKVNCEGVKNLATVANDYLQELGIKGFIHASTDKVYGNGSKTTYHETDELKPLPYPYDESKAEADKWLRSFVKTTGFPAVLLRFCNVYGPGDFHKNRLIPGNIYKIHHLGQQPLLKVWKDAQNQTQSFCRDLIYIDDLMSAITLLMDKMENNSHEVIGEAFNLGTSHCYEINNVMNLLLKLLNSSTKPLIETIESGEIPQQTMNFEKAQRFFGFEPKVSLEEGLAKTVDWYVKNGEQIYGYFE